MKTFSTAILILMSFAAGNGADTEAGPEERPDAHLWYLGYNSYAVKIGEKVLIFDYQEQCDPGPPGPDDERGLEHGFIDPEELRDFDCYVFVTHSHQDHFDPVIFEWEKHAKTITYIFGWKTGDDPDHHYMVKKRASAKIDGMEVYTIYSHHSGVPEVAYLVKVDDYVIYHNGDYKAEYVKDYDYLRTITDRIDIAFVIGHPDETHQYFLQAKRMDELFETGCMIPMNRLGYEPRCRKYAKLLEEQGAKAAFLVPEKRGDHFVCPRKREAAEKEKQD
jgi:L-ascorbate metabolism protein UlaG (beta-lactamase superfamily)